jgi:hypothetical protein
VVFTKADVTAAAAEITLGLLEHSEAISGCCRCTPTWPAASLEPPRRRIRAGGEHREPADLNRPSRHGADHRELAAELADDPRFVVQRLRGVPVRGYHNLAVSRLRRHPNREGRGGAELNPLEVIKRLRM